MIYRQWLKVKSLPIPISQSYKEQQSLKTAKDLDPIETITMVLTKIWGMPTALTTRVASSTPSKNSLMSVSKAFSPQNQGIQA